ncbi:MAG: hypothetical protein AMXMBFR84_04500 [Candidatus Hydrogenedentota bacterium]
MRRTVALAAALVSTMAYAQIGEKANGYRGIWYMNQPTKDEFVYKYSGGLGTYCAKHIPQAIYSKEANKTFFVYGGTVEGKNELLEMVSCYDHATGTVPRPTILMNKGTSDAHDNPVIAMDDDGFIWVFASSHGTSRPSYIFKSTSPFDIQSFNQVLETNFSYPQPWHIKEKGFLFLHTYYAGGRGLYWHTSTDGMNWTDRKLLAHIQEGHYQISWPYGDRVGTAFNYHPTAYRGDPKAKGLNWRTNLYYIETPDMGATWRTVDGKTVETPINDPQSPARVHDYEAEDTLVYLKDLNYDAQGRPIILHVTSHGWQPGPDSGPREVRIAHWNGNTWDLRTIAPVDHNYDMGSLYVEDDGTWRIIFPTEPGPQPFGGGGEIAVWTSKDNGAKWELARQATRNSPRNHMYCRRPVNAHPDFYAFWADGHSRQPSESNLFFCDKTGENVFRLPPVMEGDSAKPDPVSEASATAFIPPVVSKKSISAMIYGGSSHDPNCLCGRGQDETAMLNNF